MSGRYYVAVSFDERGQWMETFGDYDKECVDYEVECWRESEEGARLNVKRRSFATPPSQAELEAWINSMS